MTEEKRNDQDAAEESQGIEASESDAEAVTSDSPPTQSTRGFAFGEAASTEYPTYVDAALAYAADNKYEYGPRFRNVDIKWNIVSAEPMSNDIVRVRVEFMPTSGFRGDPGSEYMDVDAAGGVLARRQISIPKENKPVMLMGVTAFSVILAAVLISLMTVFETESGDPLYVAGRTLWIRAEQPKAQDFIVYSGADVNGNIHNWAMKPEDEANNVLAYIKVTLINQASGTVNLVIDEGAAVLLDGNRASYTPIDTVAAAYNTESNPKYNVPGFIPMWNSVQLNVGEQVVGMLVFEVPRGSKYSELRWTATDSATIRYQ